MHILVAVGSGVKNGNTAKLAEAFAKGAKDAGNQVDFAFLGEKKIEGCTGCGACQKLRKGCAVKDDMKELYPVIEACDMVVLASPLYFWTISGRLKAFVDRFYAFSENDRYPHKETALLMTAGDDGEETFSQAVQYYHVLADALKWTDRGMYLAGGCAGGEAAHRTMAEKHLDGAYQFGLSIK